jgi:hypothetical protein
MMQRRQVAEDGMMIHTLYTYIYIRYVGTVASSSSQLNQKDKILLLLLLLLSLSFLKLVSAPSTTELPRKSHTIH